MEKTNTKQVTWTRENSIDLIRKLRNDLIKDYLDERNIVDFFARQYNRHEITAVKIELIKKDLKELLIEPVDVKHYESLIGHICKTGSAAITEKHEELFRLEVEQTLKKYVF